MIKYKIDIIEELKKDYALQPLALNKIISESSLQALRNNKPIGFETLNRICLLLNKDINDIIELVQTEDDMELLENARTNCTRQRKPKKQ